MSLYLRGARCKRLVEWGVQVRPSRSANTGNANNSRNVTSTGSNNNNNANNGNYLAPAFIFRFIRPDASTHHERMAKTRAEP